MKKLIMIAVLVSLMVGSAGSVFAYWKCDLPGVVIQDPAPDVLKLDSK